MAYANNTSASQEWSSVTHSGGLNLNHLRVAGYKRLRHWLHKLPLTMSYFHFISKQNTIEPKIKTKKLNPNTENPSSIKIIIKLRDETKNGANDDSLFIHTDLPGSTEVVNIAFTGFHSLSVIRYGCQFSCWKFGRFYHHLLGYFFLKYT